MSEGNYEQWVADEITKAHKDGHSKALANLKPGDVVGKDGELVVVPREWQTEFDEPWLEEDTFEKAWRRLQEVMRNMVESAEND